MEEKGVVKGSPKSPVLAGFLSLFPGVGAIYNGQVYKGFLFIIIFAGLITLQDRGEIQPFVGLLLPAFIIYTIIDAIQTANRINMRAAGGEEVERIKEELPQVVKTGSIFWGLILLALGVILLLANFDVIDYDTLFDFWPVLVIILGLKLVYNYVTRKNNKA
jgi:hypothetical protein